MTPPSYRWLDAAGVAEFLALKSARVVREQVALRADFPKPLRIGGVGHPRWRSDEVAAWAARERVNPGEPLSRLRSRGSTSPGSSGPDAPQSAPA